MSKQLPLVVMDACCPGCDEKPIIAAGEPYDLASRCTALMRELRD